MQAASTRPAGGGRAGFHSGQLVFGVAITARLEAALPCEALVIVVGLAVRGVALGAIADEVVQGPTHIPDL